MDKGQHLRLIVVGGTTQSPKNLFIALCTELTAHFAAQTEDSSTKDTTDSSGSWNEYDVVSRSGDIQFTALLADRASSSDDPLGEYYVTMLDRVVDTPVDWKLVMASGSSNRTIGKTICSGKGKITNLVANAQNRQKATYNGTLTVYGPVTVGSD
jgi:hypothetical protein